MRLYDAINNEIVSKLIQMETKKIKLHKEEKMMVIDLICNEQMHIIIKDHTKYESEKYKLLERIKVKIKDM